MGFYDSDVYDSWGGTGLDDDLLNDFDKVMNHLYGDKLITMSDDDKVWILICLNNLKEKRLTCFERDGRKYFRIRDNEYVGKLGYLYNYDGKWKFHQYKDPNGVFAFLNSHTWFGAYGWYYEMGKKEEVLKKVKARLKAWRKVVIMG